MVNKKSATLAALLIAAAFSFTSCKKIIDKLIPAFDTSIPDFQVTIPVVAYTNTAASFGSATFYYNLDSAIKAKTGGQFGVDDISSVKVKDAIVNLTNADQFNNMANFSAASVMFYSNTNTDPVTIGSVAIPDAAASTLNIAGSNSPELKPYLKGNQFTYTITGQARRITMHSLNAVVSVTLSVK